MGSPRDLLQDQSINSLNQLAVMHASRQLTHEDLTDTDQQQSFNFSNPLPQGAFVIGAWVEVTTEVDDGAAGTATCDVGISGGDTDAFLDAADLTTAAGIINIPKGGQQNGFYGGETITIVVDGSVNLSTMSAGDFTVHVLYHVVANIL